MNKKTQIVILKIHQLELILNVSENDYVKDLFASAISKSMDEKNKRNIKFDILERDIDEILDELTLLLCSKGLNSNDEPNQLGLQLEEIIDIFSTLKYENNP